MKYTIGFDGSASAELSQLLHAVERQINGLGTGILASMDAQAQGTASTAQPCDPSSANCSGGSSGGHDAVIVVVTAVVAGTIGYVAGRVRTPIE